MLTPADYHDTLLALFQHGSTRAAAPALHITPMGVWFRLKQLEKMSGPLMHRPARNFAPPVWTLLGRQFIYETVIDDDGLYPGPSLVAWIERWQ